MSGPYTPPVAGSFPPSGPTTLQNVIKSYLYQQYSDDDNLQSFVDAYNQMAQAFLDWFNTIGIPIYTGPGISNTALDWVAKGLYGISRPALPSGLAQAIGPFNTYSFNSKISFNGWIRSGPIDFYVTNDDIFRRVITWHFFKDDGKVFNIRWLKRRVMRFLFGTNGVNFNVDQTYQVSVTFSGTNQVNITIFNAYRFVTGGALFNKSLMNGATFNQMKSALIPLTPIQYAPILQEAISAGVLELPFQFTYVVSIVG